MRKGCVAVELKDRAMSKIIGNTALKHRLCNDVAADSLSHAYILEGAEGSGRKTLALMTAAALSCERKNDIHSALPCLECASCKKILDLKSPDVIFLGTDGKASVGVDVVRFLKEDVHVIPNDLDHKFYIIEDADKMTPQAQNAILLTLEEPPSFVHFFLLCSNSVSLLETIRSRAPTLRTEQIPDIQIDEYICSSSTVARQIKTTSPAEYNELIKASQGSIGKAIELLDTKSWSEAAQKRLLIKRFLDTATKRNGAKAILPLIGELSTKRDILIDNLNLLHIAIRDLILLKKSDDPPLCFFGDINEAIEICDRVSLSFLFSLQNAITNAIDECRRNANVRLLLMKMAISANLM